MIYLISEEQRNKIKECIYLATHTSVPFKAVNDLLFDLESLELSKSNKIKDESDDINN